MSLAPGTRIGPYQVVSIVGAGGMGEVYRARDPRLKRDVALKVLPGSFARDPERLARFEREAEVLASLNHPHIAHIHGLEDSGPALVMEFVEGEDLAQRISRGPIPLNEALPIARQIAEALEAAHERGIIHRDLKPANIKVTSTGEVKVLDFGLAKLIDSHRGAARDLANSPTVTSASTTPGLILGTAAYMPPEQVRGQPVDRRADVWAFGVILYEMLTGQRAFRGDDVSEVLAAVIKDTPPLDLLPGATPPSVHRLLRRCLEKDWRQRLADMSAVRLEIADALEGEPAPEPSNRAAVSKSRERWVWIASLVALNAIATLIGASYFSTPPDLPEMRLELNTPSTSEPFSFALSPDGRKVVFVATEKGQNRLWLQALDAVAAQPLPGTDGAVFPFWKPDSGSVGFFSGGKLKRLDLGGGSPRSLANVIFPKGGTWSREGVILFAPTVLDRLWKVSDTGGEPAPATTLSLPNQTAHLFPHFLPDGQQFVFYSRGTPDSEGIYLGSLRSQTTTRVTRADSSGIYTTGRLLFVRQEKLVSQRFDPSSGHLTRDPVTVADPVAFSVADSAGAFSASSTGTLIYRATGGAPQQRQLVWFDRAGNAVGTLSSPDSNSPEGPALAPDGRRAAISRMRDGNRDIFLIIDPHRSVKLTSDASIDLYATWSPDGRWIAFISNRKNGTFDLYRRRADGLGSDELILPSSAHKNLNDWSKDDNLLYSVFDPKTGYDLWWVPLNEKGAGTPTPFLREKHEERSGQFSPDGRWVAYVSDETGQREIYVRPFPGPGPPSPVSTAGGIAPRWEKSGKELYYIAPDGTLMAAPMTMQGPTLQVGLPVRLFATRIFGGGGAQPPRSEYTVSPDGRFLININLGEPTASPMIILLNWKPRR